MATTKTKAKAKPTSKSKIKTLAKKAVPARKPAKAKTPRAASRNEEYLNYSGKFTVRLPKSLHQALVDRAEKEGVSLNLFVTNALSRTVAVPSTRRR